MMLGEDESRLFLGIVLSSWGFEYLEARTALGIVMDVISLMIIPLLGGGKVRESSFNRHEVWYTFFLLFLSMKRT